MVLTRERILAEIASGNIEIDPFDESLVGAASVDLHIGDEIRVLEATIAPVDISDDTDFRQSSRLEVFSRPYALGPGQTVLGITRERIRLAPSICGWLEGRSRFARMGLTVHVTAGFLSPGINNRQVLEISNVSGRTMLIHPRTRICQVILQRTEGEATYSGRFRDQDKL